MKTALWIVMAAALVATVSCGDIESSDDDTASDADSDSDTDTDADTDTDSDTDTDADTDPGCTWTWFPLSLDGPEPMGTVHHDAVWMPEYGKMLVQGGIPDHETYMSMYDPVADTWESTTGCNNGDRPGIVWTGEYELKWANNGFYNPFTDTCGGIPSGGAAPTVDRWFTTVWTGTEMIVWGGGDSGTNTGARYLPGDPDPGAGSWTATSTGSNCPSARNDHTAVWADGQMIVWGGAWARYEHRREIQSDDKYLANDLHRNELPARARWAYGSLDRKQNDSLGGSQTN
jgi:hypothetical protein